jgi:hypothetical protein
MSVGFMSALRHQLRVRKTSIVTCDDHPWLDSFAVADHDRSPEVSLAAAARLLIERLAKPSRRATRTIRLRRDAHPRIVRLRLRGSTLLTTSGRPALA